jgi:hypothetical protein
LYGFGFWKIRFDEEKAIDPAVLSELAERSDGYARRLLEWQIGVIALAWHTSTRHAAKRVEAAMLERRLGRVMARGSFCNEEELGYTSVRVRATLCKVPKIGLKIRRPEMVVGV